MDLRTVFKNAKAKGYTFSAEYDGEVEDADVNTVDKLIEYADDESDIYMHLNDKDSTRVWIHILFQGDYEEAIQDYNLPGDDIDYVEPLS